MAVVVSNVIGVANRLNKSEKTISNKIGKIGIKA